MNVNGWSFLGRWLLTEAVVFWTEHEPLSATSYLCVASSVRLMGPIFSNGYKIYEVARIFKQSNTYPGYNWRLIKNGPRFVPQATEGSITCYNYSLGEAVTRFVMQKQTICNTDSLSFAQLIPDLKTAKWWGFHRLVVTRSYATNL